MPIAGLEYLIQLNDQISAPLKQIKGEIDRIGNAGKDAMMKIGAGVAGLVATGVALHNALAPALEMDRALGDLNSLNVAASGIEQVKDKALELSSAIGASSVDIAQNAYNVKKALRGINDSDLGDANNAVHLLATVTKGNADSATHYVGVMHGIFEKEAKAIGEARWVENLASKTEKATLLFGNSVQDFDAGFATLSNSAQMHGHSVEEQFAVIGQLNKITGGGAAAAGRYKKVLKNVEGAQKDLGLTFYDSNGKMNDMLTILTKIKGKYGNAIPESKLIKAFGNDGAAAIKHLLENFDQLKSNMNDLKTVDGISGLRQKAIDATDGFLQLSSAWENIKIAIGTAVLKKLYPIIGKIAEMAKAFGDWLTKYKNIARWLGYIVGGVIALTGFTAALTLFSGVFSAMGISLKVFGVLFKTLLGGLGIFLLKVGIIIYLVYTFRNEIGAFFSGVVRGFQATSRGFEPLFSALGSVWHSVQRVWAAFQRVFTAIFGGSDSLQTFGSIGEMVGYVLGSAFNAFVSVLELIASLIEQVASIFEDVAQIIIVAWNDVLNAWGNGDYWGVFTAIGSGITGIFTRVLGGVKNMFFTFLNWLIDKVNGIGEYIGITLPKFETENTPEVVPNTTTAIGNTALQIANTASTQSLRPKADSNGQVFSLGTAQPEKLQRSPNISKSMTTTNTYNYNTHIGAINTNKAEDAVRAIKEREQLS